MSQIPNYYPSGPLRPPEPNPYGNRAAIMLYILGALGILLGTCVAAGVWMMPVDQLLAQLHMKIPEPPPGVSIEQLVRISYTVVSILGILYSGALGILGMFVRRGGRVAAILASILCSLAVLYFGVQVLVLLALGLMGNSMLVLDSLLAFVPVGLFGVTLIWLIQFLRGQSVARRMQHQGQFGQMQQQPPPYDQYPPHAGYPPSAANPLQPPPSGYGAPPPAAPSVQPPARPLPPDQENPSGRE